MSFLTILIIILVIVYFLPRIVAWLFPRLLMWHVKRRVNNTMRDAFGSAYDPSGRQKGQKRKRTAQQGARPRRKGKIIGKDVGEYVEFEDLRTYQSSTDYSTNQTTIKYTEESQITDAEWEEIPK